MATGIKVLIELPFICMRNKAPCAHLQMLDKNKGPYPYGRYQCNKRKYWPAIAEGCSYYQPKEEVK